MTSLPPPGPERSWTSASGNPDPSTPAGRTRRTPTRHVSPWAWVVGVLTTFVGFLIVSGLGEGSATPMSPIAEAPEIAPLGPSHAGPMTPEWKQFAQRVDYACSYAYNTTAPQRLAADRQAAQENVPRYQRDAVWWGYIAKQQEIEYRAVKAMGEPPARRALFDRWVANLAVRTRLFKVASQASAARDYRKRSQVLSRGDVLKSEADRLGSRFGLRVCSTKAPA